MLDQSEIENLITENKPLPDDLEETGWLHLRDYKHPLPASLKETGELFLEGYSHPIPAHLKKVTSIC
jgi:hypothetical protein